MARQTVLTDIQKAQILEMTANGATPYAIGKAMGLPPTTVRRHTASAEKCKKAATDIVRIEKAISSYSIPEQSATMNLLAGLRAISNNLTRAAVIGSENSARLQTIAKMQLDRATEDPESIDVDMARDVAGFTRMANEAAALGMQLVNANKDKGIDAPEAPSIDPSQLSPETLAELIRVRNATIRG